MMNDHDSLQTLRSLLNARDIELTGAEMQQILDDELSKPEDEMDADLVDMLLVLLEEEHREKQQAAPAKRRPRPFDAVMRVAAVLVLLAGLALVAFNDARASKWHIFRTLFPTGEEYFLVSMQGQQDADPATPTPDAGITANAQVFTAIDEVPEAISGYPVLPSGIPERFSFRRGSLLQDGIADTLVLNYGSETQHCVFSASISQSQSHSSVSMYPKTMENVAERYVGGVPVYVYQNTPENTFPTMVWLVGRAEYSLCGDLTEEEAFIIIESTMNTIEMEE